MTTLLCIGAFVGCGLVLASAATKIPVWIGTFVLGLVVLIPLAMQVFK